MVYVSGSKRLRGERGSHGPRNASSIGLNLWTWHPKVSGLAVHTFILSNPVSGNSFQTTVGGIDRSILQIHKGSALWFTIAHTIPMTTCKNQLSAVSARHPIRYLHTFVPKVNQKYRISADFSVFFFFTRVLAHAFQNTILELWRRLNTCEEGGVGG